jgi:hypothetical protein
MTEQELTHRATGWSQAQARQGYNGWANYETWLLALWVGNEESLYEYWERERAIEVEDAGELAHELKEYFEESQPALEGFWADLLGAALSEVNWYEIASHWVSDVKEERKERLTEDTTGGA